MADHPKSGKHKSGRPKSGRPQKMSGGKPAAPKRGRQTQVKDQKNATRMMTHKVKTARGRKISSKLWIERQINDPYVREAQIKGYRSRAAFKLSELDDQFQLLTRNALIVDLGCAPGDSPDIVLSDLAANTTGHRQTDHLKTVALVEAAAEFAMQTLKPGGHFVTKVFQGGAEKTLLDRLKMNFKNVRHAKPKASRAGSPEMYLVAKGFKGRRNL